MKNVQKYFYIFNHPYCPMPYTHRFFVEKFAKGFEYHGYTVKLIEKPGEIVGPGIMIMCDIRFHFYWNNGIRNWRRDFFIIIEKMFDRLKIKWFDDFCWHLKRMAVNECATALKRHDVTVLAWLWDENESFLKNLDLRVIYTGEYFSHEPMNERRKKLWHFYNAHAGKDALPIRFAAAIDPGEVGKNEAGKRDIVVSYIGERRYKLDWQEAFAHEKDCRVIPTPPYIPEVERVDIYKRSLVSLGLESQASLNDGIVTERIFEALAYGAISLSHHKEVVPETDGCAEYIESVDALHKRVSVLKNNPEEAERIRQKGYAFIRQKGTYAHEAGKFIELAERMREHSQPLVSVIIPTYNSASYIREAIDSVLAQTYPEKEVIVVDDGSKDNTREILEPLIRKKKIAYYAKENGGPSAARNLGIAKARGEFVAFLDSDDIYLPTKLEAQVGYLINHPDCGVSYCDIWHFYDGEPDKLLMNTHSRYAGEAVFKNLLKMNFMNPLMVVIRRSEISRVGVFDESYPRSEDWEYWVRLAYHGVTFSHLDSEPLAKYRIRKGGLSYGWSIKVEEKKTMLRIFENLKKEMTPSDRKKYHIGRAIFRQRMKLWFAYFGSRFYPLQWFYQWLQKKRLESA